MLLTAGCSLERSLWRSAIELAAHEAKISAQIAHVDENRARKVDPSMECPEQPAFPAKGHERHAQRRMGRNFGGYLSRSNLVRNVRVSHVLCTPRPTMKNKSLPFVYPAAQGIQGRQRDVYWNRQRNRVCIMLFCMLVVSSLSVPPCARYRLYSTRRLR